MNGATIPTAEEFVHQNLYISKGNAECVEEGDVIEEKGRLIEQLIIFAKLHVHAALKAASDKAQLIDYSGKAHGTSALNFNNGADFVVEIDKKSILSAYPENNII